MADVNYSVVDFSGLSAVSDGKTLLYTDNKVCKSKENLSDLIQSAVENKLDTTAFSTVSGNFLTAHQSLDDYATKVELNTASSTLVNKIDYVSGQVDNKLDTTAAVEIYQPKGDYLTANALDEVSGTWNNVSNIKSFTSIAGIGAETSADSLQITTGDNVSITTANNTITISAKDTTYDENDFISASHLSNIQTASGYADDWNTNKSNVVLASGYATDWNTNKDTVIANGNSGVSALNTITANSATWTKVTALSEGSNVQLSNNNENYTIGVSGVVTSASDSLENKRLVLYNNQWQELNETGAFEVVELKNDIPDVQNPNPKVIYLTKKDGSELKDLYTEWIYSVSKGWEIIGETSVDLSNYYKKTETSGASEISVALDLKEDKIFVAVYNNNEKTSFADIKAAYDAGKKIYLKLDNFNEDNPGIGWSPYKYIVPLNNFYTIPGGSAPAGVPTYWFQFDFLNDGNPHKLIIVKINDNDSWSTQVIPLQDKLNFEGKDNTITAINNSAIGGGKTYNNGYLIDIDSNNNINIRNNNCVANSANYAYALGNSNSASGNESLSVGLRNKATQNWAVAIGKDNNAFGTNGVALGDNTSAGNYSLTFGKQNSAVEYSIAGGSENSAKTYSIAFGSKNTVTGDQAGVAIGSANTAYNAFAYGKLNNVNGPSSGFAVAFGIENNVTKDLSIAFGKSNSAGRAQTYMIGESCSADGRNSIAIGYKCYAHGENAFACGNTCTANSNHSFAIGYSTKANGIYAFAEGNVTTAQGLGSHAEGIGTIISTNGGHAGGLYNKTSSDALFVIGNGSADDARSDAFIVTSAGQVSAAGNIFTSAGNVVATNSTPTANQVLSYNGTNVVWSDVQGGSTYTAGTDIKIENDTISVNNMDCSAVTNNYSVAIGLLTSALSYGSFTQGENTLADTGRAAHAEGLATQALANYSHSEGSNTVASGEDSHSEGYYTRATERYSHAEGRATSAQGEDSHAEGYSTSAVGKHAHAEGENSKAKGETSHSEGYDTSAIGNYAHAEGCQTIANSNYSHSEGQETSAMGIGSHAEGWKTKAGSMYMHVCGKFNQTSSNALFVVGNGIANNSRSDAFVVNNNGVASANDFISNGVSLSGMIDLYNILTARPSSGTYILKCVNGILSWVEDSNVPANAVGLNNEPVGVNGDYFTVGEGQ